MLTVTLTHCWPAPRPAWLLRTQIVSFSWMLVEFSAALFFSVTVKVSITLMDPKIWKDLFFRAAATAIWAASAHSQQLLWQI